MKLFASIATACLVVALTLALHRPAEAQGRPCVWGEPVWTVQNTAAWASTQVTVRCNGGITACHGRLDVSFWVLDEDGEWAPYETPNMQWSSAETTKICGDSYSNFTLTGIQLWPSGATCRISYDWRVWDGSRYNLARWKDNTFETP